ncbi:MAG: hypothetical protein CL670_07330 [Balneola sp.]|jgi:hypothetical protein|nr:hypothetical protein [Balneola sp.]MBE78947.1 hypothetical protein [Balneola sp.]|tara:strand:+ start:49 stop:495 length:447 start_codon:yes stop_codon:yes gene_type:complete
MSKIKPTWYKLIVTWCQERKPKGYGLTIPFVLGVEIDLTIQELLTEIKDSEYEFNIILQRCEDLDEYVLSIPDKYTNPFVSKMKGDGSLRYNEEELIKLNSFQEVIDFISEKYEKVIAKKKFSKQMVTGEWGYFDEDDLQFIAEVINN